MKNSTPLLMPFFLLWIQAPGLTVSFQQNNVYKLSPEELWAKAEENGTMGQNQFNQKKVAVSPKKKKVMVDRHTAWNVKYQELAKFYQQYGNFNKVRLHSPALYRWMVNQRNKRAGKGNHSPLTQEQIQMLDKIEFPWAPRSDWKTMYDQLAQIYHRDGHLQNIKYKSSLYVWMETQRRKRMGHEGYAPLTKEQVRLLDEIQFCWNPSGEKQERQQEAWEENYQNLVEFYQKHGHLKVPSGSNLYTWMVYQRVKRDGKGKYTPLTKEQIRLLDDINFPWAVTNGGTVSAHEWTWHQKYQELVDFQRQHGHWNVKRPSSLYTWMINQRRRRAGKGNCAPLSDEQIRLLDEAEFPWVPSGGSSRQQQAWNAKYQELADFFKQHGHLKVPRPSPLYTWMNNQRSKWRNTMCNHQSEAHPTLTLDQIRLLDNLEFPWELQPRENIAAFQED